MLKSVNVFVTIGQIVKYSIIVFMQLDKLYILCYIINIENYYYNDSFV